MALATFKPNATVRAKTRAPKELARGEIAPAVRETVLAVVNHASNNAPRSLQRKIGPSEIGEPCARQVAHKLAGTEIQRRASIDPMPSILGTAFHAWMEPALERANEKIGRRRWISERRVTVAPGIFLGSGTDAHLDGSCDCYDCDLFTVIDWKLLGNTQYAEYVDRDYVSEKYRVQAHSYGKGYKNAGYRVDHVSLAIFGRNKRLDDLFIWSEPFDESIADAAIARLTNIQTVVAAGISPDQIKATPTRNGCYFCPWRPSCPEAKK